MTSSIHASVFSQINSVNDILSQLRLSGWLPNRSQSSQYGSCLSALVVALKLPVEISELCDALPSKNKVLNHVDLLNSISHFGYIGRNAKIPAHNIDDRLLPCLYVINQGEEDEQAWVILNRKKTSETTAELTVFCGATEQIILLDEATPAHGNAYFFTEEKELETSLSRNTRQASSYSWFRALLERFKSIFWQVFAASVFLNIVALAAPLFVMLVYDKVISSHSLETLTPLLMGAGLALGCEWVLRRLRSRSLAWFGSRLDTIVSNKIFEQLLVMPLIYTERASVSAQIARLKAFETIRDFFTGPLFLALIELPFTLIVLVAIAIIGGKLAFIPLGIAGLYILLISVMRPKIRTAIRLSARAGAKRQQMMFETFQKMHGLRTSGVSKQWQTQFRDLSGKASISSFQASFLSSIVETVSHGLFVLAGMAVIVMAIDSVIQGQLSTGGMIACTILVWRVLSPFQILCNALARYEQLGNAIEQVNRLMDIDTEVGQQERTTQLPTLKGKVSFAKVGLRYTKNSDPVFAGLSFEAAPGELIAITGGNGSGKSTILQLVNGFYKPQAGAIRIDEMDIRQLDPIELRKKIAYVPQAPNFFDGSILDNLRFAEPLANEEDIHKALEQVDVLQDIQALPQGLETHLGSAGNKLPSSLLYRLSLARAYLQPSKLMLFDELPYALLNSHAGEAFFQMLKQWKGRRTMLIVSHREDYLNLADKVILLRTGEMPRVGTPEKMIQTIFDRNR